MIDQQDDPLKIVTCKVEDLQADYREIDERFVEYHCYYCGTNIESKEHLKDHKKNCHDKFSQISNGKSVYSKLKLPPIAFPPVGFPPV